MLSLLCDRSGTMGRGVRLHAIQAVCRAERNTGSRSLSRSAVESIEPLFGQDQCIFGGLAVVPAPDPRHGEREPLVEVLRHLVGAAHFEGRTLRTKPPALLE